MPLLSKASNVVQREIRCLLVKPMGAAAERAGQAFDPATFKHSNVVQRKYILYDITGFTQKWHSIPVATKCITGTMFTCKHPKIKHESPHRLIGTTFMVPYRKPVTMRSLCQGSLCSTPLMVYLLRFDVIVS